MTVEEFTSLVAGNKYVVAKFSASWCGPCRALAPIFEKVTSQFPDVKFVSIDCEEDEDVATFYRVRNVPTIILFRNGETYNKIVGGATETLLVDGIKSLTA